MAEERPNVVWRSNSEAGSCVEVGFAAADEVLVRDSKHPDGPVLTFSATEWRTFVEGIRNGIFDG